MKYSLPDVEIRKTGRVAKVEGVGSGIPSLRFGGRHRLDRSDEGHRIRGKSHPAPHCE